MTENDGFGGGVFSVGGVEDGEQGVDFAAEAGAGGVDGGGVGGLAEIDGGVDEGLGGEGLGAAHGAAVLGFDHAGDAVEAEGVGAGGDDGGVQGFEADGAVFLGVDGELEHALEGGFVFGAEVDDFLPLECGEEGGYALAAEFPYTDWVSLALLGMAKYS